MSDGSLPSGRASGEPDSTRSAGADGTGGGVTPAPTPAPSAPARSGPAASSTLAPSILIVDDDAPFRSVLRRVLEREGYRALLAEDGRTAWTQLTSQGVDLVITDLIMPEVEGVELILRLRREYPQLPVIAMSGGGRVAPACYLTGARFCGAHATLAKPFAIAELLTTVRQLLPATTKSGPAPSA